MIASHPMSSVHLIRQSCHAVFRAICAEKCAIVLVRQGRKAAQTKDAETVIRAGYLGVLPARVPLIIENQPSQGSYIASALLFDETALQELAVPPGDPHATSRDDRLTTAFERAATALDDPLCPERLREHAVREVLLWLAEVGIGFGSPVPLGFKDQLRAHVSAEPDHPWRAAEAARAMAVSEATLRRRLSSDGTTFGNVLADVRMTLALGLLQTTSLPINRIALDVGYACPSRFAQRFRARFGITPSAIRTNDKRTLIDSA